MSKGLNARVILVGLICFVLGAVWGNLGLTTSSAEPTPPKPGEKRSASAGVKAPWTTAWNRASARAPTSSAVAAVGWP